MLAGRDRLAATVFRRRALTVSLAIIALFACERHPKPAPLQEADLPYRDGHYTRDCRWGATPNNVMDVMFEMANLKKDDLLFDLGCGDGRVVVAAAKRFGLAGVGIEIDPEKIIESRKRARASGVENRVYFANRDLFQTDFSRATVLALFLSTDVLEKLRPRLLRQLRPGTRIVLHTHSMGAWWPDRFVKVDIDCFDPGKTGCFRVVKLFIVPSNVTGTWRWKRGGGEMALTVKQKFQEASGTLTENGRDVPVSRLRISGDRFIFSAGDAGRPGKVGYSGTVAGDTINGTVTGGMSGGAETWTARRDPGSRVDIAR